MPKCAVWVDAKKAGGNPVRAHPSQYRSVPVCGANRVLDDFRERCAWIGSTGLHMPEPDTVQSIVATKGDPRHMKVEPSPEKNVFAYVVAAVLVPGLANRTSRRDYGAQAR
ncbi:MAG TPA: hypothetical protein VH351_08070 [Bryobacteraceae bacterium]|nr:hypothetical protein [Bryobacteraceae bacterium]